FDKLFEAIERGGGECIYVSGVPGTGKTATVRQVVSKLRECVDEEALQAFDFFEINGMKMTDPNHAYVALWTAMFPSAPKVSHKHAMSLLLDYFKEGKPHRPPRPTNSSLIVVAIANTMDLPERMFSHKINSRVGRARVPFNAYTVPQLVTIIESRLAGTGDQVLHPEAVEFCARKVAGMSGDARRALDICRRAVEVLTARQETASSDRPVVTRKLMSEVINEMFMSPAVQMVQRLSFHQQTLLLALLKVLKRSGQSETTVEEVLKQYETLCCSLHAFVVPWDDCCFMLSQLYEARYLLLDTSMPAERQQRVRMLMAESDLFIAIRTGSFTSLKELIDK
ncbi:P-loop containing nucleoside triphosphate hydrolase protein, partial [Zopfochytrium polystomum]